MSDKKGNNGRFGEFSIEEIIAEVKAEKKEKAARQELNTPPPARRHEPREEDLPPTGVSPADEAGPPEKPGHGQNGQEDQKEQNEPREPKSRVIPFETPKKQPPEPEVIQDEEGGGYPDEEYEEDEDEYIEEDEPEELPYDFLNIPFDEPTRAVKSIGKKLRGMSVRLLVSLFIMLCGAYLTLAPVFNLPQPPEIEGLNPGFVANAALAGGAAACLLLGWEVTTAGIWRLFRLRPTLDSLTVFSSLCVIIHGVLVTLGEAEGQNLCFISIMCMTFALGAKRGRAAGLRRVYKCMEMASDPAAVKVTGGKKDRSAIKTHANAVPEGQDAGGMDLTEKTSLTFAPIAIIAVTALSAAAAFIPGRIDMLLPSLAAIASVVSPMALCLSSVRPWNAVAGRLFTSGASILNYKCAVRLSRANRVGAGDGDIFPLGSVHIAGMKITTNSIPMEQVVADAAAVMRDVGGGVGKAFGDFAREQYLAPRKAINIRYFQGGGISAQVRDDYVLMGSAAFLERMGVRVREGSEVKNAVFVAVNSYEAAIFTLKYSVQPQPYAAFGILGKCGIITDMAVRDFGVSEDMVGRRFAVKSSLLNIPPVEVTDAYRSDRLAVNEPPCAVLTRDSFLALAEVLGGARCVVRSVRINLFCAYACAIIGMATMYFLAASNKLYLASPVNIALYLLVWYLPVWFTGIFMTKY